jgi:hypothetical protein
LKPDHEQVYSKPGESGPYKSGNRLFVFLICLVISAFIWFLIVLSKETNTIIEYPIVFENNPGNLVLISQSDSVLSLNVSSGSIALITLKYLSSRTPVKIDLSNVKFSKDGNLFTTTMPTIDITRKLINRMSVTEDHVTTTPQFITLVFESISGVKVKVIPNLILDFEKQYQLSQEIQVIPDSVTIVGPKEMIHKIEYIETVSREVKKINQSQTISVILSLPENAGDVKCIPEKVNVILTVDKFTESEIEIPIVCTEPGVEIKTFPDKIKITYFVTLENFNRIDKNMFLAKINYDKTQPSDKLKVNLLQYPSFIKIIKIEPEEVEYLVIKQ